MAIRLTSASRVPVTSLLGRRPRKGEDIERAICDIEEQNALEANRYARTFHFNRETGIVEFFGEIEEDEDSYLEDRLVEAEIGAYFDEGVGEWIEIHLVSQNQDGQWPFRYYGDMETCGGAVLPIGSRKVA